MITLEQVGDRIEYIPEAERGEDVDNPTKFFFEKKPREDVAQKRDELIEVQDGSVSKFKSSTVAYKVTLYQLCDWQNVCDADGEVVPFDENSKEDLYDRLPVSIQNELENEFSAGVATREEDQAQEE